MRILIAEDDQRIAQPLSMALTSAGFVVEIETDGEVAWYRGDTEEFETVILDLRQRLRMVRPSSVGRPRSRITVSNSSVSPRYQATSPSASISTTKPALVSATLSGSAMRWSSSAMRMRISDPPALRSAHYSKA